jgi:hypothetical protein
MDAPQNIAAVSEYGKLGLAWSTPGIPRAQILSVALDPEFTQTVRSFLIPHIPQCFLDVGPGPWFIRIGSLFGTPERGSVVWSGIIGPVRIDTRKPIVQLPVPSLPILHTQPIVGGLRIHTGLADPTFTLLEMSEQSTLPHSKTRWMYSRDVGKGWVDCIGLEHPNKYSIRVHRISGTTDFPTNQIIGLCGGQTMHGKVSAKPVKAASSGSRSMERADEAILRQANFSRTVRFSSHSDYLRFVAAQTRATEEKQ